MILLKFCFCPVYLYEKWDGFHFSADDGEYSYDSTDDFSRASVSLPELSFESDESHYRVSFSRYRRDWGIGEYDLLVSESARPMEGVELKAELKDILYFTSFTGNSSDPADKMNDQKIFSAHLLEYNPYSWLYLSFSEAAVWGKRMEISYLNPLSIYYVSQNQMGDLDNIAMGGSMGIRINPSLYFYTSVFIDEIEVQKLDLFFVIPKISMHGIPEIKTPVKIIPFGFLKIQYTKIEPYCYTHYNQDYPYTDNEIDISYTNDGESIGYPLPPNSDEIMIKLSGVPAEKLFMDLIYSRIRHGDNPDSGSSDFEIEGDIEDSLDYSNLDQYPDKDFLDDGIYEILNIFTLNLRKQISDFTVWGEYSFLVSKNLANVKGNNKTKNYLSAGIVYKKSY